MSRQMAFQMTYSQLQEKWAILAKAPKPVEGQRTVGDWIDAITKDEKEREMLLAAYSAIHSSIKAGRDVKDILKVIVWRDADGKSSQAQLEFRRRA